MPKDKITLQWHSANQDNFRKSLSSMWQYDPPLEVTARLGLKGLLPQEAMDEILEIASKYQLDIRITLTGTSEDAEGTQLVLWPPGSQSVRDAEEVVRNYRPPSDEDAVS